jgi:RNA polymerase sigma factor (sigma-70 family)
MNELNVSKLKAGEQEALRGFYDLMVPKIRRVVAATLQRDSDVEDVVEQVLSRILSNLDVIIRSEEPPKIEFYCLRVAKNTALEARRRIEKEDRVAELTESRGKIQESGAEGLNPTDPTEIVDDITTIRELLSQLSELDQMIIVRRYMEDRSIKEISEQLDMSPNTIRPRLVRAMRKLRQNLEGSKLDLDLGRR